ncbi:MAG: hypothetical protein GY869_11610, partial [Planctomycetes bacterium]|nr:hypothetical protein [Planctomycetota bacterium]
MSGRIRLLAGVVLAVLILAQICSATSIAVPSEQPTIQAGIDAAMAGDTVVAAPGTYTENIDFLGKRLVVKSELGAESTIIEAADPGLSVVSMISGEPIGTELIGFTVQNSNNTGIRCRDCSPRIAGNIVRYNSGEGDDGGGIGCLRTTGAVIEHNVVHDNYA